MDNDFIDFEDFVVRTYRTLKFGDISREVYRYPNDFFEITDFKLGWFERVVTKDTLLKLMSGEIKLSDMYEK